MEFNSPSTVNLVCLNIYNTVQLKIETSIYCVGGAPTRKSAAAAAARRCPKIGGGGATKKSAAAARRDQRRALVSVETDRPLLRAKWQEYNPQWTLMPTLMVPWPPTSSVSYWEAQWQGWTRDVKARDRDAHLPRPRRWLHQPRRDVCSSRDVIETWKYKFYW